MGLLLAVTTIRPIELDYEKVLKNRWKNPFTGLFLH